MIIPKNWDIPGKDNEILCQKFKYMEYHKDDTSILYRLFIADTKTSVPMVIFLHGADAIGRDNEIHLSMHDIGTMFARDQWQKRHPCHIAAPQYSHGMHWSTDEMDELIDDLVEYLCQELNADTKRIYIYGYSAGGVGTLRYIKEHPGKYAGAISICGATSVNNIENLKLTPLWMIHAADDNIVKASYMDPRIKELYHYGSRDIFEATASDAGHGHIKYTELPAGYMTKRYNVNPHCSWVEVSNEKKIIYSEWLFQQRNIFP